ncbi:hypothetical protein NXF25_001714 [Crotalus adamanteus]|uniref:Uncharacterized protein n=1 Tax=Crotalus adamanteus TaxID=8729 RepID=A0AAW1C883_CROAD
MAMVSKRHIKEGNRRAYFSGSRTVAIYKFN